MPVKTLVKLKLGKKTGQKNWAKKLGKILRPLFDGSTPDREFLETAQNCSIGDRAISLTE